jgi:hypothetical protein
MKDDWQLVGTMLFGFSGLLGSFGSKKSGLGTLPQLFKQGAEQNNEPEHKAPQPAVQEGEGGPDAKLIRVAALAVATVGG